jgi:mono/diheme cytochrome c family protein
MSQRPDDTLFDGVYAGGYILNKSQLMPAYGHTLDSEQILDLVKYMRTLCDCTGPGWSTDNQK